MTLFTNPVFQRELLTGLRSAKLRWILLLYLLVPFGVIANVWPTDAPYYGGSELAAAIWQYYFYAQLWLVVLLTPVFAAYTVSSEFQQGTAEFLWTSRIAPRAIIRGKMFAVILLSVALLSASLASLSIVFHLGGVDVLQLVGGFILLVAIAVAAAAIAVFYSARFKRGHLALVCTYVTMAAFVPSGGCVLGAVISSFSDGLSVFGLPTTEGFALAIAFCLLLVALVFAWATPATQTIGEKARPNFKPIDNTADLQWRRRNWPYYIVDPMRRLPPLPDAGNVIASQEPRVHPLHKTEWGYRCTAVMAVLAVPLAILAFVQRDSDCAIAAWWITFAMTSTWTVLLHAVSMTMDQEMGTLEAIRLTRIRPREFLVGKWLGSIRMRRVMILIGVLSAATTFFAEHSSKSEAWILPLVWWALVECIGLLTFAVSSFCSRTMPAISMSVAAVILGVTGGVWLFAVRPGSAAWAFVTGFLPVSNLYNEFLMFGVPPIFALSCWLLAEAGVHHKWSKER